MKIEDLEKQINEQIPNPQNLESLNIRRKHEFTERIRKEYSNRLMIIDEAHNLRLPSENGHKQISTAFQKLLQTVENVKLVMMTATPMYNTADEIVWLMNLLLTNDKRDTIKRSDIFDKDANLTDEGRKLLRDVCRGYVSYMRGENPYTFPFRLFPNVNNAKDPNILTTYPKLDIYGQKIPEKIKFLEIITSKMSKYQKEVYDHFKSKITKVKDEDYDDDIPEEMIENNDVQNTMQISNVVYPAIEWDKNPKITYGSRGFKNCFQSSDKTGDKYGRIKYIDQVKNKFGEFLSYDKLKDYAPKIKTLIDYIKKANGIVFIYSRYYEAGIYPLACALEHVGMMRYSHDGKHRNVMSDISINDQFNGKKPKYIILSRRETLSPANNLEIEKAKSKENLNGEIIKVIIVSKIGTEGIDFKRIREVHILEPWYNLNRAEQIIGRAVRTCSHIDLPKEQRNVTIYFHANTCENEESVDLRTYRISESKQKKIIEVETILKETSIDCNLNKDVLMFTPDKLKLTLDIVTSQGKIIKNYKVGDKDDSFICGFKKCEFKCDPNIENNQPIDNTTFDTEFIKDDVELMKKYIAFLYVKDQKARTYENILKELHANYKLIEDDIVNFAIEDMINQKYRIRLPEEQKNGYLIYRSDKYIFQYETLYDTTLTLEERKALKSELGKKLELDVSKLKKTEVHKEAKKPREVTESMEDVFNSYYEKIVTFFINIIITDPGKTKAYLETIDSPTLFQRFIITYFEKIKSKKASSKEYKTLEDLITEYEDCIYDLVIDRLTIDNLFIIKNSKSSSPFYQKMKEALIRSELVIDDFILDPNTKNLYKLNNINEPVLCGPADRLKVKNHFDELLAKIKDKPPNEVKNYTRWQKNKLVFKVRDNDKTLGAVCDTAPTLDELKEKVKNYLKLDLPDRSYQKSQLCLILELLSRKTSEFKRALYINSMVPRN